MKVDVVTCCRIFVLHLIIYNFVSCACVAATVAKMGENTDEHRSHESYVAVCLAYVCYLYGHRTFVHVGYIKQMGRKRNSSEKTHIEMGLQSGCMRACACFCVAGFVAWRANEDSQHNEMERPKRAKRERESEGIYMAPIAQCLKHYSLLPSFVHTQCVCLSVRGTLICDGLCEWAVCVGIREFSCGHAIQHNITPLCKRMLYDLACSKLASTYT